MFFTLEDYKKIEEYLRLNSKKDTDFPTAKTITDDDYVPIIQDAVNKKMSVEDLRIGLSKGPRGESAYECAVRHGYVGTEEEWLASLDGKSAYQIAVELGYVGTEEEWLASLKGEKGDKGKDADVWTIGDDDFWYLNGNKTIYKSKGEDGKSPILRISPDGQSLEISTDGGQTWLPFEKDFNKLRVIGYVDSVDLLPKNAIVGDIYGVWNPDVYSGRVDEEGHLIKGAYDLYINTVKDWAEDYLITRVYSYDTELPSIATDGTTVLVPVKYLTLDKEKIDGYKVYRYSFASRGWTMLLNTSEIFASKEDIINHGDNLYALVQGDLLNVPDTISNWINGTLDGTESYQEDNTSIIGTYALDANIKAIRYNIAPGYTVDIRILSNKQFNPSEITAPNVLCGTEGAVIGSGKLNIPEGAKSLVAIIKRADASEEELPVSAGSYLSLYHEVATTYKLYRRVVDWVFFGTNASITYKLVQTVDEGTSTNILSGQAVKDAIAEIHQMYGEYEENPEFVRVYIDNEGRFLWGIRRSDGAIIYGAGVPPQVKDYIDAQLEELIPHVEKVLEFLDGIQYGDKTLLELLNEKVDKLEGKSLIDADYAEGIKYIENPEFKEIKLDNEDKILEAIMNDGTKYLPEGANLGGTVVKTVNNPEFICAWIDSCNHIIAAFKADGDILFGAGVPSLIKDYIKEAIDIQLDGKVDKEEGKSLIDEDFANGIHYEENPEFIEVKLDTEKRILEAIYKKDGTKLLPAGYDINGVVCKTLNNPEFLGVWTDDRGHLIAAIKTDGDIYFGCSVPTQIKEYIQTIIEPLLEKIKELGYYEDNPEFVKLLLDNNNKIIKAITKDGFEYFGVGVKTGASDTIAVDNPEFFKVYITSSGQILWALTKSGDVFYGAGVPSQIVKLIEETIKPFKDLFYYINNPEFVDIKLDAFDKILEGYKTNGTKFFNTPVENTAAEIFAINAGEFLSILTDAKNRIINSIDKELESIRYGGINLTEIKRDLDAQVLEVHIDADNDEIYTIENNESTITLEIDNEWNVYEVRDSSSQYELSENEEGEVFIEETINEV